MLTLNHAQMNEESGPDFSHSKSCPDACSESPLVEDEKDASRKSKQSPEATPIPAFLPQALGGFHSAFSSLFSTIEMILKQKLCFRHLR